MGEGKSPEIIRVENYFNILYSGIIHQPDKRTIHIEFAEPYDKVGGRRYVASYNISTNIFDIAYTWMASDFVEKCKMTWGEYKQIAFFFFRNQLSSIFTFNSEYPTLSGMLY